MSEISLAPIIPIPFLIALGGLILGLAFWSILKSARGVWFRLGASLLVVASLFNPQITSKDTRPLKDIGLIIIDESSSQNLIDRKAQMTKAITFLKKETGLYKDLEIRTIVITPDGKEDKLGTRIITPLKQALSNIDPKRYAGSVLISDGQVHDAKEFGDLPGPFHLLLTGSKKDIDRRLEIVDAPRYGLVGDALKIRVRVFDNGTPSDSAKVHLIKPDGTRQAFPKSKDNIQEITFTPKHAGQTVLIVETDPLKGEISADNNKVALNINGVRDRLRVLLVSGMPHQGQRTWRNILRSDPSVDLVHFTILRPSEKEDFTPLNELSLIAFPVRELFEDKLNDFDLIIFDRYYKHNVLSEGYFDNITQYVNEGGAVLISAGPDFSGPRSLAKTRLNAILSVRPTGSILQDIPFKLKRSNFGKRHPITSNLGSKESEWGRWMRVIETQGIEGKALLKTDKNAPILVVNRMKQGRVAILLSDHIWLWARGFDGGGPHSALVKNLVHWLMKEPDLEEEKLTLRQLDNAELEIRKQTLFEQTNPVTLKRPDGTSEQIIMKTNSNGQFIATTKAAAPGIYRANDGDHTATLTLGNLNPKEFIDPRASVAPLQKMIEKIGGSHHWINEGLPRLKRVSTKAKIAGTGWFGLRQNHAEAVIGIKKTALLPAWFIFLSALGLITMGWWRESR